MDTNKTALNYSGEFQPRRPLPSTTTSQKRVQQITDQFSVIGPLLQQPTRFFEEIREGINLGYKIKTLLGTSVIFLMVYGAVLGSGDFLLSLNTALGVPFLFLGSLITCIPVMYLLDVLTGSQRTISQMVATLLASVGAASTVFFCFTPIMFLFGLAGSIQQYFWLNIGILAMSTLVGLIYITQGLIRGAVVDDNHPLSHINRQLHFMWMLLFLMVISQMAWGMKTFFEQGGFSGIFF